MNGSPGLMYMESVAQASGSGTLTLLTLLATSPAAQGHLGLGGLADRADDGDVAQQRVRECPTHVGEAIVKRFGRGAHRHTGQANGTMPEICPVSAVLLRGPPDQER